MAVGVLAQIVISFSDHFAQSELLDICQWISFTQQATPQGVIPTEPCMVLSIGTSILPCSSQPVYINQVSITQTAKAKNAKRGETEQCQQSKPSKSPIEASQILERNNKGQTLQLSW